jgi:hypothetical protein
MHAQVGKWLNGNLLDENPHHWDILNVIFGFTACQHHAQYCCNITVEQGGGKSRIGGGVRFEPAAEYEWAPNGQVISMCCPCNIPKGLLLFVQIYRYSNGTSNSLAELVR